MSWLLVAARGTIIATLLLPRAGRRGAHHRNGPGSANRALHRLRAASWDPRCLPRAVPQRGDGYLVAVRRAYRRSARAQCLDPLRPRRRKTAAESTSGVCRARGFCALLAAARSPAPADGRTAAAVASTATGPRATPGGGAAAARATTDGSAAAVASTTAGMARRRATARVSTTASAAVCAPAASACPATRPSGICGTVTTAVSAAATGPPAAAARARPSVGIPRDR